MVRGEPTPIRQILPAVMADLRRRSEGHSKQPPREEKPMTYSVTIIRRDALAPVRYEHAKQVWWQGPRLYMAFGEHEHDRRYVVWLPEQIDHVRIDEEAASPSSWIPEKST